VTSGVLASGGHGDVLRPTLRDPAKAWAMPLIVVTSAVLHGVIVAAFAFGERERDAAPPAEIPVQIVIAPPRPISPPPKTLKTAQVPPAKPVAPPQAQPKPPPTADDAKQVADLEKQLADLKAQRAALAAQAAKDVQTAPATEQARGQEAPSRERGGPLSGSTHAVALPGTGGDDADVVGYQALVFSQLAKAKGIGEYHGAAGTTGVHFTIDADGKLVSADVAVPSGDPALDTEALDIVRRAAPFPAPPKDAERTFFANVNFVPAKP
jgi:periplasmic protein TonB